MSETDEESIKISDQRIRDIQESYRRDVNNGQINDKTFDIERYGDLVATDIEYSDVPAKDAGKEVDDSKREVANLMRGGDKKEAVLTKWFGNNDEDSAP
jgi:hypothetical protein